jgi:hypothetical protein
MMNHPDELDLLAYVEEELPTAERGVVAQHVGRCSECWARIRELETARTALRESPELELPTRRRDRVLAGFRATEPERRTYVSPMRLATILAPVAVVAAIIGAIASLEGGGDGSGARDAGEAAQAEQDEPGGGEEAAPTFRVTLRRVAGPPRRVAELLRERGYNAVVEGGSVVVGEAPGIRQALADQPEGRVRVLVESDQPPG